MPRNLSARRFVLEIEIGQAREIDAFKRDRGAVMRIVFGDRDIGRAADGAVEKRPFDFAQLHALVRDEQIPARPIEGQRLAQEDVIQPGRRIDRDREVGVFPATILDDAVRGHARADCEICKARPP